MGLDEIDAEHSFDAGKEYLAEFDFRYSHRVKLGYSNTDRAKIALKGIGK